MTVQLAKSAIDLGIVVTDGPKALAFYVDLLGLEHVGDMPMPIGGGRHNAPRPVRRFAPQTGRF
jgi:catechol 2,3-dioxygenase-like lactoylglutathione lyase family enzyme